MASSDYPVKDADGNTILPVGRGEGPRILMLDENAGAPAAIVGMTQLYSDGSDLFVVFGDGTTKTVTLA